MTVSVSRRKIRYIGTWVLTRPLRMPKHTPMAANSNIRTISARVFAVLSLTAALLVGTSAGTGQAGAATTTAFGTLDSQPSYAASDAAAGVRFATVTVGWNMWEPSPGQINWSWVSYIQSEIRGFENAGESVIVEVGQQYTPSWVLNLPNGQLVDQNGNLSGTPNYEFDPTVRQDMVDFVASVALELQSVHPFAYRIGLSNTGEMLYANDSSTSWWAYGEAQQSSPMPGWVPGQTSWDGAPVTATEATNWYKWYWYPLVDAEHAEIMAIRRYFSGSLLLDMPGDGTSPSEFNKRLAADLGAQQSLDTYGTMNTGAIWWAQIPTLIAWGGLSSQDAVNITSVGDGTGSGACQGSDTAVSEAQADPWVSGWDDTRWLTYLARTNGLSVTGENPGGESNSQMAAIVGLARSCNLNLFDWQNDPNLYAGGSNATIAEYHTLIAQG